MQQQIVDSREGLYARGVLSNLERLRLCCCACVESLLQQQQKCTLIGNLLETIAQDNLQLYVPSDFMNLWNTTEVEFW